MDRDRPAQRQGRPGRWAAVLAGLLLALVGPVPAQTAPVQPYSGAPDATARRLRKLLTDLPQRGVRCSAAVVDLETGRTICQVNPCLPLIPASNAKLFVLTAALDQLGPDFTFRTVLAVQGPDLVVIGDGDPSLGDARVAAMLGRPPDAVFADWADALLARGISSIGGNLVLDESIFDRQFIHPTWEDRHLKKWYAAPAGALNYNDNCVDVTIWPAEEPNAPPRWEVVPKTDLIEIVFRNPGHQGDPVIDRPAPELRFVVTGRATAKFPFSPVPAPDPGVLMAGALRTALAERGITIAGEIQRRRVRLADGSLPADCRVVAEYTTPLPPVLARTGKKSQNLFAECLVKRLGYEWLRRRGGTDARGTWEAGVAAIERFLARAGNGAIAARVVDGSGLSRQNRASAADFAEVLRYMYHHPYRQLFADSLSVAGRDGSLAKRMKDLSGTVYAKTGYLNGVRTLSGYAVTPQGRWRAFSVLFNGFKGPAGPFNDIHDELCRILAADPPSSSP